MSVEAVEWVLKYSRAKLAARLVLISIANHVGADGLAFPSLRVIAKESKVSKSCISKCLRALEGAGELRTQMNAGPGAANLYMLPGMWIGDSALPEVPSRAKGKRKRTVPVLRPWRPM